MHIVALNFFKLLQAYECLASVATVISCTCSCSSELGSVAAAGYRFQDFRKKIVLISRLVQGTVEHTMSCRIRSVALRT